MRRSFSADSREYRPAAESRSNPSRLSCGIPCLAHGREPAASCARRMQDTGPRSTRAIGGHLTLLDDDGRQAQPIFSVGCTWGQNLGAGAAFEKADVDGVLARRHAEWEGDAQPIANVLARPPALHGIDALDGNVVEIAKAGGAVQVEERSPARLSSAT